MLSWLGGQWSKRPIAVVAIVFVVALAIDAVGMAWSERRPIGGFFEAFVALLIYWGGIFGSFGIAIWVGTKVAEKTARSWLGWCAGILLFTVIGFSVELIASKIPGVGWRIEKIRSDRAFEP